LRELLLIECLEIDRRQVNGRKAGAHRRVGHRLARIRKEHRGTVDGEDGLQLVGRDAANGENAGLLGLDQEHRLVVRPRGDGERQHALVNIGRDLLAPGAQSDLDLRRLGHLEGLRRAGILE
jgi:hypothetical protein